MNLGLNLTNANKGAVIVAVNSLLILLQAFFPDMISQEQRAAVEGFVNAILGTWLALTYKDSPRRIPEDEPDAPEEE